MPFYYALILDNAKRQRVLHSVLCSGHAHHMGHLWHRPSHGRDTLPNPTWTHPYCYCSKESSRCRIHFRYAAKTHTHDIRIRQMRHQLDEERTYIAKDLAYLGSTSSSVVQVYSGLMEVRWQRRGRLQTGIKILFTICLD